MSETSTTTADEVRSVIASFLPGGCDHSSIKLNQMRSISDSHSSCSTMKTTKEDHSKAECGKPTMTAARAGDSTRPAPAIKATALVTTRKSGNSGRTDMWLADSGSSRHMTYARDRLYGFQPSVDDEVALAGGFMT